MTLLAFASPICRRRACCSPAIDILGDCPETLRRYSRTYLFSVAGVRDLRAAIDAALGRNFDANPVWTGDVIQASVDAKAGVAVVSQALTRANDT